MKVAEKKNSKSKKNYVIIDAFDFGTETCFIE